MNTRPDPDQLLRNVQREELASTRGKLTVFFGAAPGVGKTFTMLEEAGYQRDVEGREVLVGVVETHGRFETTTLLAGFERLGKKQISHRGVMLEEFDLDAALARKPSILLLDELAHTNTPGSRHAKRWQDAEELLEAGVDVYSTLNVQHLESMNDIVAQVTGVVVRETVPDSVLYIAHEVKLVDLPPEELLTRLREGKVYLPAQAQHAMENFFRKGNLIALRELALRKMTERVDAEMQVWRKAQGIERAWASSDRLLVCISASPYSANLLRVGRRMASSLHAPWCAVTVETPASLHLSSSARAQLSKNLELAEQLGAETVALPGEDSVEEILRFARERNISKIVVGKPRQRRWRDRLRSSFVDTLILQSREIDLYVTTGEPERPESRQELRAGPNQHEPSAGRKYVAACGIAVVAAAVGYYLFGTEHLSDVVMTQLLGIVVVSTRFGFRPSILGAVLSVLLFDFFFVPPFYTFSVQDARHIITFGVMLLVAGVIAGLTERVRSQVAIARKGERKAAALHALSQDLFQAQDTAAVLAAAGRRIETILGCLVAVYEPSGAEGARRTYGTAGLENLASEQGVVGWVLAHRREAGLGTSTLSGSRGYYIPLVGAGNEGEVFGVLAMYPTEANLFNEPEVRRLAHALARQVVVALERGRLRQQAEGARRQIEAEQFRNTLLSSVSHDLRTPLAVMKGVATTLLEDEGVVEESVRRDLTQALVEETERLDRRVRDLLDMTRLESGAVRVRKEWQSIEEVVGAALNQTESRLAGRPIQTEVPSTLLAQCDGVLIQQVLVNLLENAAKYSPKGTTISVLASQTGEQVLIEVADRGPGVPEEEQGHIFEKFRRGQAESKTGGVGLGLTICRAIVLAHGGRIWVEDREGGGASFRFALPSQERPSSTPLPELEASALPRTPA